MPRWAVRSILIGMAAAATLPACGSPAWAGDQTGFATWYSQAMPGTPVACGWYNPNALTAADPALPCGTRVRVTRRDNGRSVMVTINDRGSLVPGEVIQLSQAAMDRLGGIDDAFVPVKLSWGR